MTAAQNSARRFLNRVRRFDSSRGHQELAFRHELARRAVEDRTIGAFAVRLAGDHGRGGSVVLGNAGR